MVKYLLFSYSMLMTVSVFSQGAAYPTDSLTTIPAIPRDAVEIPSGKPSGPTARLQHVVYQNIRYPRVALINGITGDILVHGVVGTDGVFVPDSVSLYKLARQGRRDTEDAVPSVKGKFLGGAKRFSLRERIVSIDDAPRRWSAARSALVKEALRVCYDLPKFKPGTLRGGIVATRVDIPVVFKQGVF